MKKKEITLYTDPQSMTPLFPEKDAGVKELALELIKRTAALSALLHPHTRNAIALLLEPMNSYYSNLIEGHNTHPLDIEKALKKDYSTEPKKRELQLESFAHVKTQKRMKSLLSDDAMPVCSSVFIKWLHKEFYDDMPAEFRLSKTAEGKSIPVIPGEFRKREVYVNHHIAPAATAVPAFLDRISEAYALEKNTDLLKRVIAIAASHHRLAWVHPFQDGNGRVVRLYSEALFIKEGLDANGLWCISRGLAIHNKGYYSALHNADLERQGDYDGRGNLSNKFLLEFCEFFLKTAIDQVEFMSSLLDLDSILNRISKYVDLMSVQKEMMPETKYILQEAFLKGKVERGEAMRLTGKKETMARKAMKQLIDVGLLIPREGEIKGDLYINFPVKVAPYFFPRLYPKDIEATLMME
ncbi:MAG: Fic family protein [Bacteroidetes bacterium]|nr:Fic family protein [Bacteroidota bacterium]